ncbi:MAG: Na(+)-translocating NADH-quinone reductase subunit A [Bacteroidales bacterium]|nr:Na(+)-translocating NADH-quinone reductase subunit A [Bacteroidales bacterium]
MSETIKIHKGLDIKLFGEPQKVIISVDSKKNALKPTDFNAVFPKLLVKEGDKVKAGTKVFFDKYRDNIFFTSPVSGKITELVRGPKRVLQEIKIDADQEISYIDFGTSNPNDLKREEIIKKLLESGVWPMIRQRPYSIIANPEDNPKAIFISAFDTAPLAPDYDLMVHGNGDIFQIGLDALIKLTDGKIHLNLNKAKNVSKVFSNSKGVQINYFEGPHPTGNISTQINKIYPINKGDVIWYVNPQDILTIGRLFLEGKYIASKIIALTGSEVKNPKYFKTISGTDISELVENNLKEGNLRYISGNVLTGKQIKKDGYIGFYDSQITVIPEGDYYEFIGWALPGLHKFSFYRTFISWMTPKKKYRLDTNINGGERAFVMTGQFEKVFPMDIYPMQLIKAIMTEDIDQMENLGIFEVDEEDFALCEYISTSKIEIQSIVRQGLDLMRKEMS